MRASSFAAPRFTSLTPEIGGKGQRRGADRKWRRSILSSLAIRTAVIVAIAALALSACSGTTSNEGTTAYFRVPGAQFYPGPFPSPSPSAPAVASIVLVNSFMYPNDVSYPITGALGPGATAAAIGLERDIGYWIVPAGLPNVAAPNDPSYAATGTFSSGIVPGQYTLAVAAVDSAGHFGPPSTQILTAHTSPTSPTGDLVFTLTWDTESDMDLHVVDPSGTEIDHDQMSDQPPPFDPQPAGGSYGFLDWDSNANCVIDGKREEDVVWPNPPPSGTYVVRVDAASLCGQPIAHWTVRAISNGTQVSEAQGTAVDADTRGPHGQGAGVTALTLDVP